MTTDGIKGMGRRQMDSTWGRMVPRTGRQQRTTAATHQDDDGGERGDETAMGDSGDVEDGGDDTWG